VSVAAKVPSSVGARMSEAHCACAGASTVSAQSHFEGHQRTRMAAAQSDLVTRNQRANANVGRHKSPFWDPWR
jgi:hypothetical protein